MKKQKMSVGQKLLMSIVAMLLILFIGSSCVQDLIIPAYVNEEAAEWAGVPTKIINPLYTTLWDAKRVALWIAFKKQQYMIEAGFYENITAISVAGAEEIKNVVFDPSGPVGLLLPMLSGFGLGSLIISKPGDKKRITELENGAKNK